jgi:16S rRNA C967 or C1407 C5-methylase (RsmB/RsmF family)/NOL1/NOP2/fmu family ribosome biogenesis protein
MKDHLFLPESFRERMQGMLGEEYPAFLASYEEDKVQALRFRRLPVEGTAFFPVEDKGLIPVPWAENAYYYPGELQPGKYPYHMAGVYYIQEPSAMYPVTLLDPRPGERILDLCAAPGGKSTQIASRMKQKGFLLSNETNPERARILSENMERLGVRCGMVTRETPERLAERFPVFFDRILVDAPCSGEGMFRKHPEGILQWSPENVAACARRQDEILEQADKMLRPGGYLVYSTCTFAPSENEGTVSRFIETHGHYRIVKPLKFPGMSEGVPDWIPHPAPGIEDTVRIMPHQIKGEGHYAALLQKEGESEEPKALKGAPFSFPAKEEMQTWRTFAMQHLKWSPTGECITFGKQLYLLPDYFSNAASGKSAPRYRLPLGGQTFQGLHVLRPGLHLGTFATNRLEPSHALALALDAEDVINTFPAGDEIGNYYQGLTLKPSEATRSRAGTNGWYLVTVDGYSAGWAKLAGGILKNHYPKGLRWQY